MENCETRNRYRALKSWQVAGLIYCMQTRTKRLQPGGRKAFRFAALTIWNSIPQNIRLLPSIGSFKRSLKTHLFSHPGYPQRVPGADPIRWQELPWFLSSNTTLIVTQKLKQEIDEQSGCPWSPSTGKHIQNKKRNFVATFKTETKTI